VTNSPWDILRNKLIALRDQYGAVADFVRKTGFSRTTVENWLDNKNIPNVETLGKIAFGLNCEPWELIKPACSTQAPTIPLDEHIKTLEVFAHAQASTKEALDRVNASYQKQAEQLSDPNIKEAISILSTLDDEHCRRALIAIKSVARTYAATAASIREKKAK
jgi:transcriptional regulator with XRE-family HTH domain